MLLDVKIMALVGTTVFSLAIFSTIYSAFQLSTNSAVIEYKNGIGFGKNMSVGKSLLLFQFIVSIVCISATFVVGSQVDYIRGKDLGYDRHNLITLIMPEEYPLEKGPVLKSELNKLRGVVSTSFAYYHITGVPYFMGEYEIEENDAMKTIAIGEVFVDHDYLQTMKIKILMGRNFDINNPADYHSGFIVNETAAKGFGWDNPIGKKIRVNPGESDTAKWEGTVIGVIEDFNTRPLHERVQPVVMQLPFDAWPGYCLNIKIGGLMSETVALIKSTYESVMPDFLIDIRIVEDMFECTIHK